MDQPYRTPAEQLPPAQGLARNPVMQPTAWKEALARCDSLRDEYDRLERSPCTGKGGAYLCDCERCKRLTEVWRSWGDAIMALYQRRIWLEE